MGTSFPQEYTPFLTHVVRSPLLCSILVKSTQEHPLAGEHPAEPSQALPIPPAVTHINTLSTLSHLGCFRSQWKKIDSAPVSSPNTPTPGLVLFFTTCFGGSIRHSLQPGFTGLAVLDWEEWCPLWSGNWGRRQVYQTASWAWARRVFPNLDPQEQLYKARIGFEQAARALMEDTLRLGRALQPHGLWGFYRFPACGNGWHGTASNYTGHCHAATLARNTQLHWLWAASSALFPSIYLPPRLPPAHHHAFVRYRLEEAFRVALAGHPHPLPVLAYARLTHRSSGRFLSQVSEN